MKEQQLPLTESDAYNIKQEAHRGNFGDDKAPESKVGTETSGLTGLDALHNRGQRTQEETRLTQSVAESVGAGVLSRADLSLGSTDLRGNITRSYSTLPSEIESRSPRIMEDEWGVERLLG